MALLNKIIENKRDEYMINVLEESTSELESLKTKKYLTENLSMIGKILVEEGVVDAAKANLANNWGKYAAGAGALGVAGAAGYEGYTHPEAVQQAKEAAERLYDEGKMHIGNEYDKLTGSGAQPITGTEGPVSQQVLDKGNEIANQAQANLDSQNLAKNIQQVQMPKSIDSMAASVPQKPIYPSVFNQA